jgi:hypothetical protein
MFSIWFDEITTNNQHRRYLMNFDETEMTDPRVWRLANDVHGGFGRFYATVSEADSALDEEVGSLLDDQIELVKENHEEQLSESDCSAIAEKQIRSSGEVIEVDPTEVDNNRRTALHDADDDDSTQVLIRAVPSADRAEYVNAQDMDGRTALHEARSVQQARVLLHAGADPTLVDRKGRTAEDVANGECKSILVAHRERMELRRAAGVNENEPPQRSRRM